MLWYSLNTCATSGTFLYLVDKIVTFDKGLVDFNTIITSSMYLLLRQFWLNMLS